MKITIVGAGAVGGIVGAYLAKAGRDVTLVDANPQHREHSKNGLRIDGVRGEMIIPLNAVSADELEAPLELVFIAVKSNNTLDAMKSIRSFLDSGSIVVSLQNGINEDAIAGVIGPERVMGCITGWGATFVAPGHLRQTSEGKFTLGELDGRMTRRLNMIKDVLDDIYETILTPNIYGHLWAKLSINCLIAGCSVLGLTVGEALAPTRNKHVFVKLIGEVVSAAQACGVTVEKYEGLVDPTIFKSPPAERLEFCHQILDMMAVVHGQIKPGPLQDIERGLMTEVDYITGYCVDKAEEMGVHVPINAAVREIIKMMEKGRITPSPTNLKLLEEAAEKTPD